MKGLALAALLVAGSAHGQTVQQVHDALTSISAHTESLGVSFENLQGMAIGQDQRAVESITNTMILFLQSSGVVGAVASLLPKMRDPEDAKQVRLRLQISLGETLHVADVNLKSMNGYMTFVKGPAALAEATKARDAMVAIREQLRSLKTP